MLTLYLVRHAKSSWAEPGISDKDRPLNKRGKHDAPKMGSLLYAKGAKPGLMVSSPAKRAYSTAKRFADELDYSAKDIVKNDRLYMADVEDFYTVIKETGGYVKELILFSHNYGITYFANFITGSNIDNIPTCGVVKAEFDINSWQEIENQKGKLVWFEYPKKHFYKDK